MAVKVYVVTQPNGTGVDIVDAKLTWSAADKLASKISEGAVLKITATK